MKTKNTLQKIICITVYLDYTEAIESNPELKNLLTNRKKALKTLNSYGHASVCLFGGIPNTDNFMKNLNTNLYTEPDKIINAIEICVHEDELNRNYKVRKVSDDAILYEGYCVLPQERTRAVQLEMNTERQYLVIMASLLDLKLEKELLMRLIEAQMNIDLNKIIWNI